jgi:hypothetical protein
MEGTAMTRKIIGGLLLGSLLLAGPAVALAADHGDTHMDLTFKTTPKSKKAGTRTNPRPASLSIEIAQRTLSGTGQPATSKALNITLPKEFKWQGATWPKRLRCDPIKTNQAKSNSVCPKGSAIGKGHVTATAGDGGIKSEIDVTAYVTKSGDLGLWLSTNTPLPIHQMLIGKVSKARTIKVAIPSNIQQPLVGVKSAISLLRFSLTRGVVSTGCPASKHWSLKFQNVYDDGGSATATATAPCRR